MTLVEQLDAAATLWEIALDMREYNEDVEYHFKMMGTSETRGAIANYQMVKAVLKAHRAVVKRGYEEPFDWHFCPIFMTVAVDWTGATPTLRPDYMDILREKI